MQSVAFHFNVSDKVLYACRLLRKVVGAGHRVVVDGEVATLKAVDQSLWSFDPQEFIAHCWSDAPEPMLERTPVILRAALNSPVPVDVLVNLHSAMPQDYERFVRVIEVVSTEETDRLQARHRWKQYQASGCDLLRHDVAQPSGRSIRTDNLA